MYFELEKTHRSFVYFNFCKIISSDARLNTDRAFPPTDAQPYKSEV